MTNLRLAFRLGWSTLRSRPTLSALAVLLLTLGTAILSALGGSAITLANLKTEFLSALTVEIELSMTDDSTRMAIMAEAEKWPGAEFVQYVPAEVVLDEVQRESGDSLLLLFGYNPFPDLIRIRFGHTEINTVDSLTSAARHWPGVRAVVYPRKLWSEVTRWVSRLRGDIGLSAFLLSFVAVGLVGLCLRAQVRYRTATWEFLSLLGMSHRTLTLALVAQELIVGILGAIGSVLALWLICGFAGWLLVREVALPFWYYVSVFLGGCTLSLVAGLLSPRSFGK